MTWFGKLTALLLAFALSSVMAFAQTKTVTGTVIDDLGEPVLGANVVVVGTTNGATTDLDGNFTINDVPNDATLKVSFIGYSEQLIPVAGKTVFNITLAEDAEMLEDVVVVGYGTMKKSDLTGSVASVSTDKLNAKGAPSVMENLQGSTPGVNITMGGGRTGSSPSIEIRGKSSINSSVTPLYVVDGVMCDDIDWLNPQDIERIDVLKDASSTAIYGSRATAGVVQVTTKNGTNVKKDTKTSISYDGYYGWTTPARMPELMSGEQFYQYRFLKFLAPTISNAVAQYNPAQPTYGFVDQAVLEQCLLAYQKGGEGNSNYALKQMLANGKTVDWPDLVTQNGTQQNHYVAVAGAGDKVNYHMGIGYNGEKGIYSQDKMNRINFKGSVDAKINDLITAGFNFNLARQKNEYADDTSVQYAYRMNPYMQPYDSEGNRLLKPGNYEALGTDPSYQFSDQINPLNYQYNSKKQRETWRVLGNLYIQLNFTKSLNFKTTFSPNYNFYREGYISGIKDPSNPYHTYANDAWYDEAAGAVAEGWNSISQTTNRGFTYTWDNVLNWSETFANDHSVNVMGLYSLQQGNTEKLVWYANDTEMDGSDWWNMKSATFNKDKSSSSYSESTMVSYALRANYSYKGKYMLTATTRWDGSSKFADGNRWGVFPSFAAAWRITGEDWMSSTQDWLSNLKLRLSYGVTGNNAGIGNYATQNPPTLYGYYPFGGAYYSGYTADIVDKNLKWEKSHEFNVGFDYGFFNNRISGTIDWYTKKSEDLLYNVYLPLEAGLNSSGGALSMTTNVGSVRNTGLEVSLTTINIDNKDWTWTTTFNFSTNKNEILEINGSADRVTSGTTGSLFVGQSTNVIWAYEQDGIVSDKMISVPNTQIAREKGFTPGEKVKSCDYYYATYGWLEGQPIIRDVNGDGQFDQENDRIITCADPTWTGSFSTTLSYKNWDLSASLYAKVGQKSYSNFLSEYLNWGDRGRQKLQVDYYVPAGTLIDCDGMNPDGTYINPVYQDKTHYGDQPFPNNGNSNGIGNAKTYWDEAKCVVSSSYVKVKNISLGYTFPKNMLTPWHCSSLRIYGTITNPFCWTNYKGFDPEWAGASLKQDGPSTISYQIGASLKF